MRVRFRSSGITCSVVKFVMLNMVMRHDRLHPLALMRIMKIALHPGRRVGTGGSYNDDNDEASVSTD